LPGIAHLYTDLALQADRELESRLCVTHAVGGKLGGQQLSGVRDLAWVIAKGLAYESACRGD
jgi:hypothetical protein